MNRARDIATAYLKWNDEKILRLDGPMRTLFRDALWFFLVLLPLEVIQMPLLLFAAIFERD